MYPGAITISVWNCRAAVVRWLAAGPHASTFEAAGNWEDLEDAAIAEVEEQGGAINWSGHYRCSAALAARARFDATDAQGVE